MPFCVIQRICGLAGQATLKRQMTEDSFEVYEETCYFWVVCTMSDKHSILAQFCILICGAPGRGRSTILLGKYIRLFVFVMFYFYFICSWYFNQFFFPSLTQMFFKRKKLKQQKWPLEIRRKYSASVGSCWLRLRLMSSSICRQQIPILRVPSRACNWIPLGDTCC